MAEIAELVAEEVEADPAGEVTGSDTRVRVGVEKRDVPDLASIVLRSNLDGTKLTIGDIATVRAESIDRIRSYFVGEQPAVTIRVDRSSQGDAIAIQSQVENIAAAMKETLPEGVDVLLIRTRSEAISARLKTLTNNGLTGLALVVALLFLFLNARTAFWVAAGIPVAMLATIALMYLGGLTINMVSLFALIITLGIVVDDAIVVGEHADARVRKFGETPVQAAERAAHRMALPVFSATLTTLIAFFGLVFVGGRFGDLIYAIPFTVIAVLVASLIECFLILPNHMSHALKHSAKDHWYDWPSRVVNRGFVHIREKAFRPFMAFVIQARYPVFAAIVVLLAAQSALFIRGDVQWRFFNAPERGSVTGNFMMASGATRADTTAMMQELQRATEELGREYEKQHGTNPLDFVVAEIGGNAGFGLAGADTKDPDQLGGISIELIDPDLRDYSSFAFVGDLQDRVTRHPLVEELSFRGWRSGPGGDALDVEFFGASADTLKIASEALKEALLRFPEVSAVQDNLAFDKQELILELSPQGQALGFSIDTLGLSLRNQLSGIEAATYPSGPRSAEIRVEIPETEITADFLERMQIRTPSGTYVPLADIVRVDQRIGFSTIRRENGIRHVNVTGDVAEDDPARAQLVTETLREDILPEIASIYQVEWQLGGLSEQENEFLEDARLGLILTLAGIYLVLAWVFASWTRPIVVMAIIPFGLVGAIWGHYYWNVPFSMFSVIGLLGMVGIIINDSIVLVTTIDEHAKDRAIVPAILEGVTDRLRPVILTTLTTVLGLTPLLFEQSTQAQFIKPAVITLVYGLGFGMVLVLILVPSIVAIQHDCGRYNVALRRALRARRGTIRLIVGGGFLVSLIWLAATLGLTAFNDQLPAFVTMVWPGLATLPAMTAALIAFSIGLLTFITMQFVAIAFATQLQRQPAGQP